MKVSPLILSLCLVSPALADVKPHWSYDASFDGLTVELEREGESYQYSCPSVVLTLQSDESWILQTPTRTYAGEVAPNSGVGLLVDDTDGSYASIRPHERSWNIDLYENSTVFWYGLSMMLLLDMFCMTIAVLIRPFNGLR